MKEIKFRAWQKYHKKMVEVTNISFDDNGEINGVATFVENQAPQHISYRDDLLGRFFLKDERGMVLELMQYTGLKDKNGVEIYEYSELDGAYEVIFKDLRYSLRHTSNNYIIDLHDYWRDKNGEIKVTREYTKV